MFVPLLPITYRSVDHNAALHRLPDRVLCENGTFNVPTQVKVYRVSTEASLLAKPTKLHPDDALSDVGVSDDKVPAVFLLHFRVELNVSTQQGNFDGKVTAVANCNGSFNGMIEQNSNLTSIVGDKFENAADLVSLPILGMGRNEELRSTCPLVDDRIVDYNSFDNIWLVWIGNHIKELEPYGSLAR